MSKVRASVVALAVSLAAVAVVAFRLDWSEVADAWARVTWPWVIAAAAVNVANTWIEGLRWKVVLRAAGAEVPARRTFASLLVGTVGNVVLPFKLGEAARAWALARVTRVPLGTVASSVVADRIIDATAVVPLVLVVGVPLGHRAFDASAAATGAVTVVAVVAVAVAGWRWLRARHGPGSGSRLAHGIGAFSRGLLALRQGHCLVRAGSLALLSWCARTAVVWSMFQAFGLGWPPARAALTLVAINFSIVVVATPGNIGTFDLAAAGMLRVLGASPEVAVSYAVALHLAEVVPTVALGAMAIWRMGLRWNQASLAPTASPGPFTGGG